MADAAHTATGHRHELVVALPATHLVFASWQGCAACQQQRASTRMAASFSAACSVCSAGAAWAPFSLCCCGCMLVCGLQPSRQRVLAQQVTHVRGAAPAMNCCWRGCRLPGVVVPIVASWRREFFVPATCRLDLLDSPACVQHPAGVQLQTRKP